MKKKSNWQEYIEVLKRNGITKLYHFTDRDNLESIIREGGIYSWADCRDRGITIARPGGSSTSRSLDERDGLQYYARVSFVPKHPMMYVAMNDGRIPNAVVLEIDIDVISWEDSLFVDRNMTKNGASVKSSLADLESLRFDVFRRRYFDLDDNERKYYQAEVLVKNFIPLKYITNIGNFGYTVPSAPKYVIKETLSTKVTKEDLEDAVIDVYGAKYCRDWKRILKGPKDLKEYRVKDGTKIICDRAFKNKYLVNINIPDSVICIGDEAFSNCKFLANIQIPDSVTTIGEKAFLECKSLQSIHIPDNLTTIGDMSFTRCISFQRIHIPYSVAHIGRGAFEGCECKITCESPNYKVFNDALFSSDMKAILFCPSDKVEFDIPSSVKYIGDRAFSGCKRLTSVNIPESVTNIGDWAFALCTSIKNIYIPESVVNVGKNAFFWCSSLKDINIPCNIKSIGEATFWGCKIQEIRIPFGVSTIGNYAFSDCNSLKSIQIPNSIVEIGSNAFSGCRNLQNVHIPESVINIGDGIFASCNCKVTCDSPNYKVFKDALYTADMSTILYGPSNKVAFYIPDSVKNIASKAFWGYNKVLQFIHIPDSVITIGNDAFNGCISLQNIYIPKGSCTKFKSLLQNRFHDKLKEL